MDEPNWLLVELDELQLADILTGNTYTKDPSCWEHSDESSDSQDEEAAVQQQLPVHRRRRDRQARNCTPSRSWTAGKWVQNESGMQGTVLLMHHGYVQVQFSGTAGGGS